MPTTEESDEVGSIRVARVAGMAAVVATAVLVAHSEREEVGEAEVEVVAGRAGYSEKGGMVMVLVVAP